MNRRSSVTVLIPIALALLVVSQEAALGDSGRAPGQAIQFGIAGNLQFKEFGGLTFSYQRFIGPDVAWRIGATIDLRNDSGEFEALYVTDDSGVVYDETIEHETWTYSARLSSEWLWYRGRRVAIYYGGGPRVSYLSTRDEDSDYYDTESRHWRWTKEEYAGGLQGCLGIQWTACEWLALHAEYNARIMYTHSTETHQSVRTGNGAEFTEQSTTDDTFQLDSRGVRLGVSAYF